MLKELKFVKGSVAKKDLLPALTHFRIEDRRVCGYNGRISLSAPIDFDIDCTPKAISLIKAIDRCEETVQLGMTPSGKLSVRSGKFRAYIECVDGPTPHVKPEGVGVQVNGETLLAALKVLRPMIGDDAARPWSNGVLIDGQSAYATNNVLLCEYWLGVSFPMRINIPLAAINELIRIKEPPSSFQMTDSSITFHYEDGRWLRSNLIATDWPDVNALLNMNPPTGAKLIPEQFYKDIDQASSFTDNNGRIIFDAGLIRTHELGSEEGALIETDFIEHKGTYVDKMLLRLQGIATHIDFSHYPDKPCPWFGKNVRGVIMGLRWLGE